MSCKLARYLQKSVTVVGEEADSKTGISTWGTEQLKIFPRLKCSIFQHSWNISVVICSRILSSEDRVERWEEVVSSCGVWGVPPEQVWGLKPFLTNLLPCLIERQYNKGFVLLMEIKNSIFREGCREVLRRLTVFPGGLRNSTDRYIHVQGSWRTVLPRGRMIPRPGKYVN